MRTGGLSSTTVIRFPVERRARPTLALLRELAPNQQEVLAVVAAFGLPDPPMDVRARADADTAREIVGGGAPWPGSLDVVDQLVDAAVARAIVLCWSARDASNAVADARSQLSHAETTGVGWLAQRRSRVDTLRTRAASHVIEAHVAAEQAEGVARAAGFARRGEPWVALGDDPGLVAGLAAAHRASGYKTAMRSRASRKPRPSEQDGRAR